MRTSIQSCLYTSNRWAAAFTVGWLGVKCKWTSPRVGGVVLSRLDDAGTGRGREQPRLGAVDVLVETTGRILCSSECLENEDINKGQIV